jgi:bifunctional non-homologous end joining protein LigD
MSEEVVRRGRREVRLRHLEQRWWRDEGIEKRDVIGYYRAIAPTLLPHLRNRPFTLKRYPNGPHGPCFWIKDLPAEAPDWIPVARLPAKSRGGALVAYPLVNDELALLWMVDFGCVDLHVWYSRVDRPGRPDYVLFDVDPSSDVGFPEVVQVAHLLRRTLSTLGLASFVKTSGGDGLHVQVPVERRYTYEQTREFATIVAEALVIAHPGLVTTDRDPGRRRGVFVDTKMNGEGMTIASVYSLRPRPGAPVSTPLRWEELREDVEPRDFNIDTVLDRVREHGDLWAPLLTTKQRLEPALAKIGARPS